ncbi:MAG: DUF4203 domain-containing protein [Blautia sp.]|jgi:hypothetical protein
MDTFMDAVTNIGQMAGDVENMSTAALIAALVLGICNCFLGYRLMKLWFFVFGGLLGGVIGYGIGDAAFDSQTAALIVMAVGVILLGSLAFAITKAGVFVLCAVIGTVVLSYLFQPTTSFWFFLCLLAGIGVGVVGVKFVKPMVILTTSVRGGLLAGGAVVQLAGMSEGSLGMWLGYGAAAAGVTVQWLTSRKREKKEDNDQKRG